MARPKVIVYQVASVDGRVAYTYTSAQVVNHGQIWLCYAVTRD